MYGRERKEEVAQEGAEDEIEVGGEGVKGKWL